MGYFILDTLKDARGFFKRCTVKDNNGSDKHYVTPISIDNNGKIETLPLIDGKRISGKFLIRFPLKMKNGTTPYDTFKNECYNPLAKTNGWKMLLPEANTLTREADYQQPPATTSTVTSKRKWIKSEDNNVLALIEVTQELRNDADQQKPGCSRAILFNTIYNWLNKYLYCTLKQQQIVLCLLGSTATISNGWENGWGFFKNSSQDLLETLQRSRHLPKIENIYYNKVIPAENELLSIKGDMNQLHDLIINIENIKRIELQK